MTTNSPTKEGARRLLDNWQFWVGIAYFGLACVVVALWVNYTRVSADQKRTTLIVANHTAEVTAQYEQCIKSIPILLRFQQFVHGVQDEHQALLENSINSHRATTPGTPLYRAQAANIVRLRHADHEVAHLRIPVPTSKSCNKIRGRQ